MSEHTITISTSPQAFFDGSSALLQPESLLPEQTTNYLERQFANAPNKGLWSLNIDASNAAPELITKIQAAITNHYTQKVQDTLWELKEYRRDLLHAFIYGTLFLGVCFSLHAALGRLFVDDFPRVLDEGLIIIGWVALWRPAELLTYEWMPIRRRLKLQRKLATLAIKGSV